MRIKSTIQARFQGSNNVVVKHAKAQAVESLKKKLIDVRLMNRSELESYRIEPVLFVKNIRYIDEDRATFKNVILEVNLRGPHHTRDRIYY